MPSISIIVQRNNLVNFRWAFYSLVKKRKGEDSVGTGGWICFFMAPFLFILGIIFLIVKAPATKWLASIQYLSIKERKKYDLDRLAKDTGKRFVSWSAVLWLGAIFSYILNDKLAMGAFGLWLLLLIKDTHFDPRRDIEKYRL